MGLMEEGLNGVGKFLKVRTARVEKKVFSVISDGSGKGLLFSEQKMKLVVISVLAIEEALVLGDFLCKRSYEKEGTDSKGRRNEDRWMWMEEGVNGGGKFLKVNFHRARKKKTMFIPFGRHGFGFYKVGVMLKSFSKSQLVMQGGFHEHPAVSAPDLASPIMLPGLGDKERARNQLGEIGGVHLQMKTNSSYHRQGCGGDEFDGWICGSVCQFAKAFDLLHQDRSMVDTNHVWWRRVNVGEEDVILLVVRKPNPAKIDSTRERSVGEDDTEFGDRNRSDSGEYLSHGMVLSVDENRLDGLDSQIHRVEEVCPSGGLSASLETAGANGVGDVFEFQKKNHSFKKDEFQNGTGGNLRLLSNPSVLTEFFRQVDDGQDGTQEFQNLKSDRVLLDIDKGCVDSSLARGHALNFKWVF